MKKDKMQGIYFIVPNRTDGTKSAAMVRPQGVIEAEEKRKFQELEDVKIKLSKITEVQQRLKALLEKLARRVEEL